MLGTFYGLATTVPAVVETIKSLAPKEGQSSLDAFEGLMIGLESQLGGMGTAFASSLLGLAGSLVVGLLELFAGHGQNRFYMELEEWLSSISKIGQNFYEVESTSDPNINSDSNKTYFSPAGYSVSHFASPILTFLIGELELAINLVQEDGRARPLIVKLAIEDQPTINLPLRRL